MKRFLTILAILCVSLSLHADEKQFAVAWWNVENLFDEIDDPDKWDDWMPKQGKAVYQQKIANLANVLKTMNKGKAPELIALGEVESPRATKHLADAIDPDGGYHVIHIPGNDHRGIEVALLSRFPVVSSKSIYVYDDTRDLLHVQVNAHGKPLHLIIGHWKSRYGGVEQTAPARMAYALKNRQLVDRILLKDPAADIIVLGDFNDNYDDNSVTKGLEATTDFSAVKKDPNLLHNVSLDQAPDDPLPGTYNYKGNWSYLDQLVVSIGLYDQKGIRYVPKSFVPYTASGKLMKDGKPYRFTTRTDPPSGASDHLPILATFEAVD